MPDAAPIYLDHAASTPVRPEVRAAMEPFYGPQFGNPSSAHRWGRAARAALDGLPNCGPWKGSMAARTSGRTGVVAAWSR